LGLGFIVFSLVDDLNLQFYSFDKFGKNALKAHKLSPDAFIQIAFQLAYYRSVDNSLTLSVY
jgi:Choline/Carnitine o-acyltransferase